MLNNELPNRSIAMNFTKALPLIVPAVCCAGLVADCYLLSRGRRRGMVTADGTVKILDFGLAKLAGSEGVTQTGTTVPLSP